MVLDAALLNTQHYKVRIKGKIEQSREWSSDLLGVVAIEKGVFGSLSTTVGQLTYTGITFLLHRLIQGTKSKFGGNNGHFVYFSNVRICATKGLELM